jgi:hypothetical protein
MYVPVAFDRCNVNYQCPKLDHMHFADQQFIICIIFYNFNNAPSMSVLVK